VPPTTPGAETVKSPVGNAETGIATPAGPAVPSLVSFPVPVFPGNLFYAGLPEFPLSPLPPTPAAETAAAAEQEGPFILQRAEESQKRRSFSTLQGAIADARSGDVILLKYNGHPAELPVQPPVRVVGINLIIRAAEGFRPTLEFESETVGVVSRAEMITVRNRGSLTVRDLDLRVRMTSEVSADRWSLFRLDGPNRVQLENVTLDCQNADHQSASVFDLSDEASSPDDIETSETSISLDRVVCRGDVDGFRISSQPQGRIRIRNSAFAVSGTLLTNLGSTSMLQTRGDLELWMEHSSFVLGNSLILMKDSDELTGRGPQRTLPTLRVNSDACVFASAAPQGRLVVSEGNSYVEEFESLLTWNGFTNLYFQYSTLWHLETAALDYTSRGMDSVTWREFWRNRSDSEESNAVEFVSGDWLSPLWSSGPPIPFTTFQPNLIQLNASSFDPASGRLPLARDGLISGVDVAELPDFPVKVPLPEIDPLPAPISAGAGPNRSSQTPALSGSSTVPPAETLRTSDSPLP
jgi:serine/threonine-protein kinase